VAPCAPQPPDLLVPVLLAVVAEAPLAAEQPIAAATAAFCWQAAFIAPVHWAAAAAEQPPFAAVVACAAQPPSAGAACTCPFAEATTAFAVVVDPAFAVLVALLASHAWASVAVQAHAMRARASSRSDFMDPTSRKVMAPRHSLIRGARPLELY
jgi:hypothetical protein